MCEKFEEIMIIWIFSACLIEYLSRNVSKLRSSDRKICRKIEKVKYSSKIDLQVKIFRLSMIFEIKS